MYRPLEENYQSVLKMVSATVHERNRTAAAAALAAAVLRIVSIIVFTHVIGPIDLVTNSTIVWFLAPAGLALNLLLAKYACTQTIGLGKSR